MSSSVPSAQAEIKEKQAWDEKADQKSTSHAPKTATAQQQQQPQSSISNQRTLTEAMSIDEVMALMSSTSLALRRSLVFDQILRLADSDFADETAEKEFYTKASQALLSTAFTWTDATSANYVEQALRHLSASHARFIGAFAAALVPFLGGHKALANPRSCVKMARWVSVLLLSASSEHVQAMSKGLPRLLEGQCILMERVSGSARFERPMRRAFVPTLQKHPNLVAIYMQVVASKPAAFPFTIKLLLSFLMSPSQSTTLAETKLTFLKWYDEHVLGSRESLSDAHRQAFTPLFPALTPVDLAKTLLPTVSRMLKRSPEIVVEACAPLFASVPVDLSEYHAELAPALFAEMRHADAARRERAAQLVSILGQKTHKPEAMVKLMTDLSAYLLGKKESLALWQNRTTFVHAMEGLRSSHAVESKVNQQVAELALETLATFLDKEPVVEAREVAVRSLGGWLASHPSAPSNTKAVSLLVQGLKGAGKDQALVHAYLGALLSVLATQTLSASASEECKDRKTKTKTTPLSAFPFQRHAHQHQHIESSVETRRVVREAVSNKAVVEVMVKIVESAVAKPLVNRRVGLLALTLLLTLVDSNGNESAAIITLAKSLLSKPASFVNSADLTHKAAEDEALAHVSLIQTVLLPRSGGVIALDASASMFEAAVRLLLHSASAVRIASEKAYRYLLATQRELSTHFTEAFVAVLYDNATPATSPFVFSHALLALHQQPPALASLPAAILCAHDPRLNTTTATKAQRRSQRSLWKKMQAMWRRELHQLMINQSFETQAATLSAQCLGASGLLSSDAHRRQATAGLLATILERCPALFQAVFLPPLLAMLAAPELHGLSEYEVAVFNTREGELCSWVPAGEYKAQVVTSTNVKHNKHSGLSAQDEAWVRQIKAEQEAKKGKQAKAVDPETKAKLQSESVIRDKIKGLVATVGLVLSGISELAHLSPTLVHNSLLQSLLPPVYALLQNQPASAQAGVAHRALASTVDTSISNLATPLAISLQAVIKNGVKAYSGADSQMIPHMVRLLCQAATGSVSASASSAASSSSDSDASSAPSGTLFSVPTLVFVLPLLQLTLLQSSDYAEVRPAREEAMMLLAAHCQAACVAEGFPSEEVVAMLLHALANLQELKPMAHSALLRLCGALDLLQINALLGDNGLLSHLAEMRLACLQALDAMPLASLFINPIASPTDKKEKKEKEQEKEHKDKVEDAKRVMVARLWMACHDAVAVVAEKADALWQKLGCKLPKDYSGPILQLLSHQQASVRRAAGLALAGGCVTYPGSTHDNLKKLFALFVENPDQVIRGKPGFRQAEKIIPMGHIRSGAALALGACVNSVNSREMLREIFSFLMDHGLADLNDEVWENSLHAGLKMIDVHGKNHVGLLLPMFEKRLEELNAGGADVPALAKLSDESHDRIREGVVVFMGTIARHMPAQSPKIAKVLESLIEVLRTPSHSVQSAVAGCLPALVPGAQSAAEKIIPMLLNRLATGEDYGDRKGAAFGLGGMIKGMKLTALHKFNILSILTSYVKDKSVERRQGALFAYERLFFELGAMAEPYLNDVLPHLLESYGDASNDIRESTQEAAQVIMSHLTGHGVKMVLPIVLRSLEEQSWRAKTEAIGLLGAMAYLAPKQLSSSLPIIVPRLLEVMTDPHNKVQGAAKEALEKIGSVIRNPEIRKLTPVLLDALMDPSSKTLPALEALATTSFAHSIDPASLALLVPILRRGLRDRVRQSKHRAAQVVGCLCQLADTKDLLPYTTTLMKYLKTILVDPIPEVRAVAAKALGALYSGLGEENFEGLVEWLLLMLKSDTNNVQRSGAAMGLAQVLKTLGVERTQMLLPELAAQTTHKEAVVREGYLGLFVSLPEAFGQEFHVFLDQVLPIVLNGLADPIGPVRDTALAAGRQLVIMFAKSHTSLLMPALESGIRNSDWHIRLATIQLLGTMLMRLADVPGKLFVGEQGEDETKENAPSVTRAQERIIEDVLGTRRRNDIFATIYLMHTDTMPTVGQLAWRVWKAVVHNTPRMLSEILPTLMNKVIMDLASIDEERQVAAGNGLGDLVVKMGDAVLQQIFPILQDRLRSPDGNVRQGVCLGLSEIMASARKHHIAAYMPDLILAVRDALCDSLPEVRSAAGHAFQTLFHNVGKKAIDEVVPSIMSQLANNQDDEEMAKRVLAGMEEILAIAGKDALPYLLPQLLQKPLTPFNASALATLSTNFSVGFTRYVQDVAEALVSGMSTEDEKHNDLMRAAGEKVVLSIPQDSVQLLVESLVGELQEAKYQPKIRLACIRLLTAFCAGTKNSFMSQLDMIFMAVMAMYKEEDPVMLQAGVESLETVVKIVTPDELTERIEFLRGVIDDLITDEETGEKLTTLPGFNIKKGIAPIWSIYQQGIKTGSSDIREQAALGLGEMLTLTDEKALAPSVAVIAGPLIRIVGDNLPPNVKAALLKTLGLLLKKGAAQLRVFLPQLQPTFTKALLHPAHLVREQAADALCNLMPISRKVDPVITELSTAVRTQTDNSVRASLVDCLARIISNDEVGNKLLPASITSARALALEFVEDENDALRSSAARLLAVTSKYSTSEEFSDILDTLLSESEQLYQQDGRLKALSVMCELESKMLSEDERMAAVLKSAQDALRDSSSALRSDGVMLAGSFLQMAAKLGNNEMVGAMVTSLVPLFKDEAAPIRTELCQQIQAFAEKCPQAIVPQLPVLAPAILSRVQDSNTPVRLAAQKALYFSLMFHKGQDATNKIVAGLSKKLAETNKDVAEQLVNYCRKTLTRAKFETEEEKQE